MDIAEQLRAAATHLSERADDGASPRLEAELLLARVLDRPRAYLFSHGEALLTPDQAADFGALVQRRMAGEPLAYLTGNRAFWTLDLTVNPDVLIPRPETELLVEVALQRLPPDVPMRVADLGTGSGAIALALASERPNARITASDVSEAALQTARLNATQNDLTQVRFVRSDWFEALNGPFDIIVSNPPYVSSDDPHLAQGDCRFEPSSALTPGPDAMSAYQHIVQHAKNHLTAGGWLIFEHGFEQGSELRTLFRKSGYTHVASHIDLQGHERVSLGQKIRD